VVEAGAVHPVEGGGLVGLVDDPDRRQHEPGAHGEPVPDAVVEIGLLERHFAPRLPAFDLGVFHLELGAEHELVVEAVGKIDDEAPEVDLGRRVGPGGVGVVDLAVPAHRGAFLRSEGANGEGQEGHTQSQAPSAQRPHESSCEVKV